MAKDKVIQAIVDTATNDKLRIAADIYKTSMSGAARLYIEKGLQADEAVRKVDPNSRFEDMALAYEAKHNPNAHAVEATARQVCEMGLVPNMQHARTIVKAFVYQLDEMEKEKRATQ